MKFAKRTQEVIENKGSSKNNNPRKPKKTQGTQARHATPGFLVHKSAKYFHPIPTGMKS
jgi:hypothetical protein